MRSQFFIFFFFMVLSGCHYDDTHVVPEIYLEGQQIPGTQMHFPDAQALGMNVELYLYGGSPLLPKISPDGTKLLYSGDVSLGSRGLWVMDLATQSKTLITSTG